MNENENEIKEEVINEDVNETEVMYPVADAELVPTVDEPEESNVAAIALGAVAVGVTGFIAYKAMPKVKRYVATQRMKHEERKRKKVIDYAVKHSMASDIALAQTMADANTDPIIETEDVDDIPEEI